MKPAPLFIADVHLGKLTRLLRLLGFDVLYSNCAAPAWLVEKALADGRILLSKNAALGNIPALSFCRIESSDPEAQLAQVLDQWELRPFFRPFTRCLYCNEPLAARRKEDVLDRLLPNTQKYYNAFWECPCCRRIYWQGPHYERMLRLVQAL